jgi:hypothetical protein
LDGLDLLNHVVFKRDIEGHLRGKCKACRPGRCGVYRVREGETPSDSSRNKEDCPNSKQHICACGHSNFHHELIDEQSKQSTTVSCHTEKLTIFIVSTTALYGKKMHEPASNKVLMLCGSIYKRLFESSSPLSSALSSPRGRFSDVSKDSDSSI